MDNFSLSDEESWNLSCNQLMTDQIINFPFHLVTYQDLITYP